MIPPRNSAFRKRPGVFSLPPLTPGRFFYLLPSNEKSPACALWAWLAAAARHFALQDALWRACRRAKALRQKKTSANVVEYGHHVLHDVIISFIF